MREGLEDQTADVSEFDDQCLAMLVNWPPSMSVNSFG